MHKTLFILDYTLWHYTRAVREGLRVATWLVLFVIQFFAISLHARTLFARFERLGEPYPSSFLSPQYFNALLINTLMRIVGAVIRMIVIVLGLIVTILVSSVTVGFFVVWLLFPAVVIGLWVIGILLILGI